MIIDVSVKKSGFACDLRKRVYYRKWRASKVLSYLQYFLVSIFKRNFLRLKNLQIEKHTIFEGVIYID